MYLSLSNPVIPGNYINRVKAEGEFLTAYEMGSLRLQDPSGGLFQQLWTLTSDTQNIWVEAQGYPKTFLLSDVDITEIDLAFDQNMFPFVTYATKAGFVKYYWYNPVNQQFEIVELIEAAVSPRCTLDDKRAFDVSNSDIILIYIDVVLRQLCYRIQRERYQTVHLLGSIPNTQRVRCINFADNLRLQITVDDFIPQTSTVPHKGLANYARPISLTGAYIT